MYSSTTVELRSTQPVARNNGHLDLARGSMVWPGFG